MKKITILTIIFIASSCNMNNYQEIAKQTRKKEVKEFISHKKDYDEWAIFIQALIQVESEGKENAIGTKNDVGVLQITPVFVKEVNRILGKKKYSLKCRKNKKKSLEMFNILQAHYNPDKDIEKAIKLHNPRASLSYRIKILNQMKIIKKSLS